MLAFAVVDHIDNPAGRLHLLLLRLGESHNNFFRQALCQIYGVNFENALEACPVILRAVQLPDKAKEQVLTLDESLYSPDLILKWHEPVRKMLSKTAFRTDGSDAPAHINTLGPETMLSLQFCSDLLHRHLPEYVPPDEELQRISGLIGELRDAVANPAVDPELRGFLLSHVEDMESAIAAFQITGLPALADALDKAVGSLNRRSDIVVKAEKAPSVWTKFGNLIVVVAAVCQITGAQLALPNLIKQELASGSGGHTAQVVIQSGGTMAQHAAQDLDAELKH
jgi:hypothetical protein